MSGHRKPQDRSNTAALVRGAVRRIETIEAEIAGLNRDKSDVYAEVKKAGIDPNWVRAAIAYRRDPDKAAAKQDGRDTVLEMLGLQVGPARPALLAPQPGIVIDGIGAGTADATRVRARGEAEADDPAVHERTPADELTDGTGRGRRA